MTRMVIGGLFGGPEIVFSLPSSSQLMEGSSNNSLRAKPSREPSLRARHQSYYIPRKIVRRAHAIQDNLA